MHPFVRRLQEHPELARMVAHHRRIEGAPARHRATAAPLPARLGEALEQQGIERLYSHQAAGIDAARAGRDVLAVTPTASGKTLLFAANVLETVLAEPGATSLFIYPTKALAQDQLSGLRQLAGGLGALAPPRFEIYDGDTPASRRAKIRADPPHAVLTNPDMLHAGILANHAAWAPFLSRLRWIVIDELHVYRGLFGAHVHHILARLERLCRQYGAAPRVIAASATVGNPAEFGRMLTGREFEVVDDSGAARPGLDVVFINPVTVSPYTAAVKLLVEAADAGLRSIAFTKARRVTELLYTWLVRQAPQLERRVAPYRAGYRPEERRALERRLFAGDLTAVLTTSALELGIDVGALDLCVLVGYPGSLISSWQRIGRVGRRGRDGLVVMIAMPDALDQYVVRHPELFFDGAFERAVLDPWNPYVAGAHLTCAAAEKPLEADELGPMGRDARRVVDSMTDEGRLTQDADGARWFSFRRRPHRDVSPRSAGRPYAIVTSSGATLGTIDGMRVFHECHPGAIYLHGGRSYHVRELDRDRRRVIADPVRTDHYTVVLGDKETEIIERLERTQVGPFPIGLGRLKVTVQIREFQKRRLFGGEPISNHPLDLPPLVYETVGFWIELPAGMPAALAARELHFMGGIHATEHAMIGLFPLLTIADRGDIGGISYTGHPQLGLPAIFIYDGIPGGAGLAARGFAELPLLIERTRALVAGCECEDGCPSCIQSPQCGNGNKPLDKVAASLVLDCLHGAVGLDSLGVEPPPLEAGPLKPFRDPDAPAVDRPVRRHGVARAGNVAPAVATAPRATWPDAPAPPPPVPSTPRAPAPAPAPAPKRIAECERVVVLDVETQRSAAEVGGWHRSDRMGLALAVVWDEAAGEYRTYHEPDVHRLLLDLVMADRVIGFNIDRFDLRVLAGYTDQDLSRIRTFDLLVSIHRRLGFRLSLGHLAEINLGESKSADGLQSLAWWREGKLELIESYCRKDVEVTRRLWSLGRERGYLLYRDAEQRTVRLPVDW